MNDVLRLLIIVFQCILFSLNTGFISSQDYIRLRTTTKDTKRPQKVAKKTQTYLDKVRQKYNIETPSSTTTNKPSTTLKIVTNNDQTEEDHDHPTAHLRPLNEEDTNIPETPKSGIIGGDSTNILGVQLVTPVYGEFTPSSHDSDEKRKLNDPRYIYYAKYFGLSFAQSNQN